MKQIDALKLALEALENEKGANNPLDWHHDKAITAIKEALAQPEQEPVVWMYQDKSTHEVRFQKHMRDFVDHGATYETPLYTTPPQRTWVGLTSEEKYALSNDVAQRGVPVFEAICEAEAKLKEKNV